MINNHVRKPLVSFNSEPHFRMCSVFLLGKYAKHYQYRVYKKKWCQRRLSQKMQSFEYLRTFRKLTPEEKLKQKRSVKKNKWLKCPEGLTISDSTQCLNSVAQSCLTLCDPWTAAHQASLSITNSRSLLKLMSVKSVMPSSHFILCHHLLLPPSIFPSIRVWESVSPIRWPKYWSFSFNISPSNEYSGLISSGVDWLDLLAVQGTLKSLLTYHSSKASIQCSAFFIVQFLHPYMATGKTIA